MNINVTLFGELITFAVLVLVTMKYIWPPIMKAMAEREKKIVDGLEAAERGEKSLVLAEKKAKKQLQIAKGEASDIVGQANLRSAQVVEAAKDKAQQEAKKIHELAKSDIATESEKAKQQLKADVANLVVAATEKLIATNIDVATNKELIDKFIAEV
ncbi:MAG: F0F1 ATP synthase subunit B [Gammaproteobacteria bacterium]|nr:F0F1 ATP synthase subunit B [Gammaproteobacteria bacterium]